MVECAENDVPDKNEETDRTSPITRSMEEARYQSSYSDRGDYFYDDAKLPENFKHGRLYKGMMKKPFTRYILKNYPRVLALLVGVMFPLWMLILFSLTFGVLLAAQEAGGEIAANDITLAVQAQANLTSQSITDITASAPRVCAELYIERKNFSDLSMEMFLSTSDSRNTEYLRAHENVFASPFVHNMTEMYFFMMACGESVREFSNRLLELVDVPSQSTSFSDRLSFNWIRCHEGAKNLERDFSSDRIPTADLSPQAQANHYKNSWEESRQEYFREYYDDYLVAGLTEPEAFSRAFNESLLEASGGAKCNLNGPGSAFFWFTVMTTVGYGNQAPDSLPGRTMVYTLGFASILAFGGILANTGHIVSEIFDDFAHGKRMSFLTRPWVACVVWGFVYYTWMILIALAAKRWKENRIGLPFSLGDGYWFAYLSTTTVGLGDVYLEPEVITGRDLLYFPILMLTGFVFLSAFLGKFSELVMSFVRIRRVGFVESLLMHINRPRDEEVDDCDCIFDEQAPMTNSDDDDALSGKETEKEENRRMSSNFSDHAHHVEPRILHPVHRRMSSNFSDHAHHVEPRILHPVHAPAHPALRSMLSINPALSDAGMGIVKRAEDRRQALMMMGPSNSARSLLDSSHHSTGHLGHGRRHTLQKTHSARHVHHEKRRHRSHEDLPIRSDEMRVRPRHRPHRSHEDLPIRDDDSRGSRPKRRNHRRHEPAKDDGDGIHRKDERSEQAKDDGDGTHREDERSEQAKDDGDGTHREDVFQHPHRLSMINDVSSESIDVSGSFRVESNAVHDTECAELLNGSFRVQESAVPPKESAISRRQQRRFDANVSSFRIEDPPDPRALGIHIVNFGLGSKQSIESSYSGIE